ncbi:MAG TPA: hypothetical protein VGK19_04235 [Capsulimonadaceae bacterium]|jgi:hypothetical protein
MNEALRHSYESATADGLLFETAPAVAGLSSGNGCPANEQTPPSMVTEAL